MFARNLETVTKLASDAATALTSSTAGTTACDCGLGLCGVGGPFQFLVGHPRRSAAVPPPAGAAGPEPEPEPEPEPREGAAGAERGEGPAAR